MRPSIRTLIVLMIAGTPRGSMFAETNASRPLNGTPPRRFVSKRWGFELIIPATARVVFRGPPAAGCDQSSSRRVSESPTWIKTRRAGDASADTVEVTFTRRSFADVVADQGFAFADSEWTYSAGQGRSRAEVVRASGWDGIVGTSLVRVDYPHAAADAPQWAFDNVWQAVARLERSDGCALVLSVREVGDARLIDENDARRTWRGLALRDARSASRKH